MGVINQRYHLSEGPHLAWWTAVQDNFLQMAVDYLVRPGEGGWWGVKISRSPGWCTHDTIRMLGEADCKTMVFFWNYTIWLFNIAMENDPFIDGLPIKNGDFPWLC